mgnify:CR=1 FL=1
MADYPFKADSMEREWRFTLTDPILECNQGAFRLCISPNGQGRGSGLRNRAPTRSVFRR